MAGRFADIHAQLTYRRGTKLFKQDSDGNMEPVLDVSMDAGVNLVYPIEPTAGMDAVKIRHRIPNGTPLDAYRFYVEKAWEIMEREAANLVQ